mgnify:CR=1 FL=1
MKIIHQILFFLAGSISRMFGKVYDCVSLFSIQEWLFTDFISVMIYFLSHFIFSDCYFHLNMDRIFIKDILRRLEFSFSK